MTRYDVFNGDADGICSLLQWRTVHPVPAELITGVKRDIKLLRRLKVSPGDTATVFDISLDSNRDDTLRLLDGGMRIEWFDHHFAGEPPAHAGLVSHIDTAADTCTSLIVDRLLDGHCRAWAVVGAFGDNLHQAARALAQTAGFDPARTAQYAALGELLNYNGYGDSLSDLHFDPAQLYRELGTYREPIDFVAKSVAFAKLAEGFQEDIRRAEKLLPNMVQPHAAAWVLPDASWARRVVGVMANRLATAHPERAHALLVPNLSGSLTVSVRAPKLRASGADELCLRYPTGGGRKAAAGINQLPESGTNAFLGDFAAHFSVLAGSS